jgi:hypothetical protein
VSFLYLEFLLLLLLGSRVFFVIIVGIGLSDAACRIHTVLPGPVLQVPVHPHAEEAEGVL